MTAWHKLFATAFCLPVLAGAADPEMMNLVMPDARIVIGMNVSRVLASPIGQTIKTLMRAQLTQAGPQWNQQLAGLGGSDITRYVQEVLIAGAGAAGKDPPFLMVVRGSLDPLREQFQKEWHSNITEYEGVPIFHGTAQGNSAIALLNGSLALLGQPAEVKAAIRRRSHGTHLPSALVEKTKQLGRQYDVWMIATGPIPTGPNVSAGGLKSDFLNRMESFQGGVRLSPDLHLSIEVVAGTEKDATAMAEGVHWLYNLIQAQDKKSGRTSMTAENFKFQVNGRQLLLSIRASEAEIRTALQNQIAARTTAQPTAPAVVAQRTISSGLPPPPAGMIRVQSSPSDMGTVLIPTGKSQ